MLFELHKEGKIAYKKLTNADLSRSERSHQTHIGLSIDSLSFLPDEKMEYAAMLIYKNYCDILRCEIAKIKRKVDGRLDSPKLSKGGTGVNVVNKIREFAMESPNKEFYLFWIGLDSETPLFLLVEQDSADYIFLDSCCDLMHKRGIKIIEKKSEIFMPIVNYIRAKIADVTVELQKDLEISAEIESDNPKFKTTDVKKAKKHIAQLGKEGEFLVNEYFEKKKHLKEVTNFEWVNKHGEQGRPFDFFVKFSDGLEQWIDVKTTEHEFDQAVIISKNEMRFIAEKKKEQYAIYRVYSKVELEAKLKICTHCLRYILKMLKDIDYMTSSMADYKAALMNYKIAFEPCPISFNSISDEINISYHA